MNPGDLKLLELLTVDDAAGTLHFAHRRMLLFDADAMGLLRKELIETLGLERARRILTRFGYACGYRDALTSREVVDWSNLAVWSACMYSAPRLTKRTARLTSKPSGATRMKPSNTARISACPTRPCAGP